MIEKLNVYCFESDINRDTNIRKICNHKPLIPYDLYFNINEVSEFIGIKNIYNLIKKDKNYICNFIKNFAKYNDDITHLISYDNLLRVLMCYSQNNNNPHLDICTKLITNYFINSYSEERIINQKKENVNEYEISKENIDNICLIGYGYIANIPKDNKPKFDYDEYIKENDFDYMCSLENFLNKYTNLKNHYIEYDIALNTLCKDKKEKPSNEEIRKVTNYVENGYILIR